MAAPLRRRLLFVVLMLAIVWAGVELLAFGAFWLSSGEVFSYAAMRAAQRAAAEGTAPVGTGPELASQFGVVLHPYLGYVVDPQIEVGEGRANAHGFVSDGGPFAEREPNTLVVGVFGGSVAEMFYQIGTTELARQLGQHPVLRDKRIRMLGYALGGYKQPQQLLALGYVLGLGGQFDVVITLDGFNEIALPPTENVRAGVYPLYPRGWNLLAESRIGPEERRALGDLQALRAVRREFAAAVSGTPLGWSVLANVLWSTADRRLGTALVERQGALQTMQQAGRRPFYATGPRVEYADQDALYTALAGAWRDSSIQMDRICRANGIRYFHFLQPNQYLDGSKPLGDAERAVAIEAGSKFEEPVRLGYPKLRAAGAELVAAGVEFHDLTQVFAGLAEPLYIDACCHFGERGNALVARAIADVIAASFDGVAVADEEIEALAAAPAECVLGRPFESVPLAIEARFAGGGTRDVTFARVAFASSDPSIATVSEFGVVEAQRPGRAVVTARKGGASVAVPVRVEYAPVVGYGRGVTAGTGPRLTAELDEQGRVEFTLDRVEAGATAVLLVALEPARTQLCDTRLLVPVLGAIHVPLPLARDGDGARGRFVFDPPPAVRGAVTYWQALARDSRAACDWWGSDGIAVTVPR